MKKITIPKTIFKNWENANGFHEPPPAENKTIKENDNTIHTGINKASEKRDIFSPNVIIFAFETRVVVVILFQ